MKYDRMTVQQIDTFTNLRKECIRNHNIRRHLSNVFGLKMW